MKTIWMVALLLLSLSVNAEALPPWVTTGSADTDTSFYTVGSGKSTAIAKSNALKDLSLRLIVNIESETESYSNLQNGQLDQRLNISTIQASEQLTFVKTQIVKTFNGENEIFVLVSADKSSVFNTIKDDINNTIWPLTKYNGLDKSQIIVNRFKLNEYLPTYQKYLSLLRAYQQDTAYIDTDIKKFTSMSNSVINDTDYTVVASENDPLTVVKSISNRLQKIGFSNAAKNHHLKVTFVGPELQYTIQNNHHAYKATGIVYFSFDNQVVMTKKINEFEFSKDKSIAWSAMKTKLNNLIASQ